MLPWLVVVSTASRSSDCPLFVMRKFRMQSLRRGVVRGLRSGAAPPATWGGLRRGGAPPATWGGRIIKRVLTNALRRSSSCDVRGSNNQKSFDERAAAMTKVCCWKWQRLVGDWLRHTKRKMGEWGVKRLEVAAGSLQKHEMKFLQKFWSGDPLELLDIPREFSNQASYVFNGEDAGCDVTIINYSCRTNVLENIHEMKRDTRRENKERWGGT